MSSLLGVPLVGKLFIPTVILGAAVLAFVLIVSRWLKKETVQQPQPLQLQPTIETVGSAALTVAEMQSVINEAIKQEDVAEKMKKKKKKKSCCGTKGSCCKTKKDSSEEKQGGCGCGCGTKKPEGEKGSCSSEGESSDDEIPEVLDVEELGRIAEGLRPDLIPKSSPKPPRMGRVRLRGSEVKVLAVVNAQL